MLVVAASFSIPGWVALLAAIIGVCGILGAAYAVLRSSVQTKTAQLWKEQAEAFEARVSQVERENELCHTENQAMKARMATLEGVVGAGPQIEALRLDLDRQHHEHMGGFHDLASWLEVLATRQNELIQSPPRPRPPKKAAAVRGAAKKR